MKTAWQRHGRGGILPSLYHQSWIATLRPLVILYVIYQIAAALRVGWTQHAVDYELFKLSAARWEAGLNPYVDGDRVLNFNSPLFVALTSPVIASFWLWVALNLSGLAVALWQLSRRASWELAALGIMAPLAGGLSIELGQPTLLMLPLAVAAWRSPVAVGLLMSLKPFLGLFVIVALGQRRWREALISGAVCVAVWCVLWLVNPTLMAQWIGALRHASWIGLPLNASVFGVVARLGWPTWSALLAALLVLGVTLWRPSWASTFCAALLISPMGWSYYLPWTVGPLLDAVPVTWLIAPWLLLNLPQTVLLHGGGSVIFAAVMLVWGISLVERRQALTSKVGVSFVPSSQP